MSTHVHADTTVPACPSPTDSDVKRNVLPLLVAPLGFIFSSERKAE